MVTKTPEEWDAMNEAERKAHLAAEEVNVFGADFKRDRHKNPIEQGIGSAGHETENHFRAILKYEGHEAHQMALQEIWKRDPDRAQKLRLPKPQPKVA